MILTFFYLTSFSNIGMNVFLFTKNDFRVLALRFCSCCRFWFCFPYLAVFLRLPFFKHILVIAIEPSTNTRFTAFFLGEWCEVAVVVRSFNFDQYAHEKISVKMEQIVNSNHLLSGIVEVYGSLLADYSPQ